MSEHACVQVASYMRAVLRTLAQCHSHHILHRDVKPGEPFRLRRQLQDQTHIGCKTIKSSPVIDPLGVGASLR